MAGEDDNLVAPVLKPDRGVDDQSFGSSNP
jgi:hypothetical protein